MADITVTAAQVAIVYPEQAEIFDFIAAEALTPGQAVYQATTRKVGLADANVAGKQQFRGIVLKAAAVGQPVSVLKKGHLYGFDLSGLNGDARVFLSDTAGALADAAGTLSVTCGRVMARTDPDLTRILYVEADWITQWA